MPVLLELVGSAAPKRREVGLKLGFLDNELKIIEAMPLLAVEGPEVCFREILSRWLKWAPENHEFLSSSTLANALRSKLVKERLAYDLEQHFNETGELWEAECHGLENVSSSCSTVCVFSYPDSQNTEAVRSPPKFNSTPSCFLQDGRLPHC